jgi:DNA-binding response OmpR family regulator
MPHVHLIDDDESTRVLFRRVLQDAGWKVSESDNPRHAVEDITRESPDVVVLDINMPGHDGWAVLEQLRSISDVRVVMLSNSKSAPDKLRSLRTGADDYVPKQCDPDQLVVRLQAVIGRPPGDRSLII